MRSTDAAHKISKTTYGERILPGFTKGRLRRSRLANAKATMRIAKLFVTLASAAAVVGLSVPAQADTSDATFLQALDQAGIEHPDSSKAVQSAREVCAYILDGHNVSRTVRGVRNANPDLTLSKASQFVAISRAMYCPGARGTTAGPDTFEPDPALSP